MPSLPESRALYLGLRHFGENLVGGLQRSGSARSDALGDCDPPVAVRDCLHGMGVLGIRAQTTLIPPDGLLAAPSFSTIMVVAIDKTAPNATPSNVAS
ncbi:hypothetical protein [Streptomyces coeruleorubidus]